jgi:hypothetical protein
MIDLVNTSDDNRELYERMHSLCNVVEVTDYRRITDYPREHETVISVTILTQNGRRAIVDIPFSDQLLEKELVLDSLIILYNMAMESLFPTKMNRNRTKVLLTYVKE